MSKRRTRRFFDQPYGFVVTDPGNAGAINPGNSGTCALVTAGAETRTLANPALLGVRLVLAMNTDGGDCVVTVASAFNAAGNTIITFNDVGDIAELASVYISGALRWRLMASNGVALS